MDIHKPKPWHGLREFAKEIGTIVIGVLIALGAEAVVEKHHEERLSAEGREAVRAEIGLDMAGLRLRASSQSCIDSRLAEIGRAFAAVDEGRPFPAMAYIGVPIHSAVYTQRWTAAASGGRTSLLSSDEQRDFARVYNAIDLVARRGDEEHEAWTRIRALEEVKHPSAETLARAREALSDARAADYSLRRQTSNAQFQAARIGIKAGPYHEFAGRSPSICLPTSTPRSDVARLTKDPTGAP